MAESDTVLERELEMQNMRTSAILDSVKITAGSGDDFRDAASMYPARDSVVSTFDDGFDDDFADNSNIPLTKLEDSQTSTSNKSLLDKNGDGKVSLKERAADIYATHPKRVYAAGGYCCFCVILIIIFGSLFGTVARTRNAKLVSILATFDDICNVNNNELPAGFRIAVNNPSSIGVSIDEFTLDLRKLVDNKDESDGTLALQSDVPSLTLPGGNDEVIQFNTKLRMVDLSLVQQIASDFFSDRPVVLLLLGSVTVYALGLPTSVDVRLPIYLNNTNKEMTQKNESSVSLTSAHFIESTMDLLRIGLQARVNGSDRIDMAIPALEFDVLYDGPDNTRNAVTTVEFTPSRFKVGWNEANLTVKVDETHAEHCSHAFRAFLEDEPLSVAFKGAGDGKSSECWAQNFVDGLLIERIFEPVAAETPDVLEDRPETFTRTELTVVDVNTTALNLNIELDVARDLKLRGKIPPIQAGVHDPHSNVLLSTHVKDASIEQGNNAFSASVALNNADQLGLVVSDIVNGNATMLYLSLIGDSILAAVASKYRIRATFNGFVDPTQSTPAPTPVPSSNRPFSPDSKPGGLSSLKLTSETKDSLAIRVGFSMPPPILMNWQTKAYAVHMKHVGNTDKHATIALKADFKKENALIDMSLSIANFEDTAQTLNAVLNNEKHMLEIAGSQANGDMIEKILAGLKPMLISKGESEVSGRDDIADEQQGVKKGFHLKEIFLAGMDTSKNFALIDINFGLGQNATIDFNLETPPAIAFVRIREEFNETLELLHVYLRDIGGNNDDYKAVLALTVLEEMQTNIDQQFDALFKGLNTQLALRGLPANENDLILRRLSEHARLDIPAPPPKPPVDPNKPTTFDSLLAGMTLDTSTKDEAVIKVVVNVTMPIPAPIVIGDVLIETRFSNAKIARIESKNLTLIKGTNELTVFVVIESKENRTATEIAVSSLIFKPTPDKNMSFAITASVKNDKWSQNSAVPGKLHFYLPSEETQTSSGQKKPRADDHPLKCVDLVDLVLCPGATAPPDKCISKNALTGDMKTKIEASQLTPLIDACSISASIKVFLTNPTKLDVRVDTASGQVYFDDPVGFVHWKPNQDNHLGAVEHDFKGAVWPSQTTVSIPITLHPVTDVNAGAFEVCGRAGAAYFITKKIVLELRQAEISIRLGNFEFTARFELTNMPVENLPPPPDMMPPECAEELADRMVPWQEFKDADRTKK